MRRPTLDGLPNLADLPDKVEVGVANDADVAGLGRLLDAAFAEDAAGWNVERVRGVLLDEPSVTETFVVRDGNRILATASARLLPERYPDAGYLHWVATDPAVRGKGLGLAIVLAVLRKFAADGLTAGVLETNDERLPALALYLGLGFVPQFPDATHVDRWSKIFENLAAARRRTVRPLT